MSGRTGFQCGCIFHALITLSVNEGGGSAVLTPECPLWLCFVEHNFEAGV